MISFDILWYDIIWYFMIWYDFFGECLLSIDDSCLMMDDDDRSEVGIQVVGFFYRENSPECCSFLVFFFQGFYGSKWKEYLGSCGCCTGDGNPDVLSPPKFRLMMRSHGTLRICKLMISFDSGGFLGVRFCYFHAHLETPLQKLFIKNPFVKKRRSKTWNCYRHWSWRKK